MFSHLRLVLSLSVANWAKRRRAREQVYETQSGFTLVELIMVLAIVGVLGSLAAPRFAQMSMSQDLEKVQLQLRDHLSFARNYAQTHQTTTRVCPVLAAQLNDNPVCLSEQSNHNVAYQAWAVVDATGTVLTRSADVHDTVAITGPTIAFDAAGRANNDTLCIANAQDPNAAHQRLYLVVSRTGRVRNEHLTGGEPPCAR